MQLSALPPKPKRVKARNSAGLTPDQCGQARAMLKRYRARLERQYNRTLKELIAVQAARKERERQARLKGTAVQ